jgi:signal transduction histidine kinase
MSLVKNMLEVSRYEQGVSRVGSEAVVLEQIATSCIEELDAFAKMAAIEIVLEMETAIEPFDSDPVAIRRLLTNLIENAIKFSEKGSQVKVKLDEDERGIHVSVVDCGPGMEASEVERIFSPYWQGRLGRQTPSGAGIGLYLCRQIATSLGGSIICKSNPGTGSIFCVTFPRVL